MSDLFGDDLFDVFNSEGTAPEPPKKRKLDQVEEIDEYRDKKKSAKDDKSPPVVEVEDDEGGREDGKMNVEEVEELPEAEIVKVKKEEDEDIKPVVKDGQGSSKDVILIDSDSEDDEDEDNAKRLKFLEDMEEIKKYLPQIEVKLLETVEGSGYTHCVTLPKDHLYIPLVPIENPVKTYPFKLDHFQERAVRCVDNYQSVLISAHTSAGKTVVAEYAIAKGLKDNQRVIYTTPIKALSNQKYREFNEEFKDVGLITGDVTINPSASCIIMTTEILRNMLYRGSEIMREVGWVIFDEIHYMRDKERGVVWEETIILLPSKTHYVFLSATIPNAGQFAQWITHLHKQPCNVIHTDYRPVPLLHYVVPDSGEGLQLILDDKGNFKEEGFNRAMALMQDGGGGGRRGGGKRMDDDTACFKAIVTAMDLNMSPMIVFSFSKKDCELYALQLSKRDFNSDEDKKLVEEIFKNAIDVLNKDDQKLPQVDNLLPLLKKGVGIHHGGLLPLLKETVELLFFEGLIKVLFATETFAMGLNMPAKSVLFTNVRKFDGKIYRWISPGEYIQMSGRAGRRGIDDKGHSIVIVEEKITPAVGRAFFKGSADPINSTFRLTYNMVLNLMRVPEVNTEYMMEKSFFQFQNYSSIPILFEKLKNAEDALRNFKVPKEKELGIATYHKLRGQLEAFAKEFKIYTTKPKYLIPFMQPGRMIYVRLGDMDFGWGAVICYKQNESERIDDTPKLEFVLEALLLVDSESAQSRHTSDIKPPIKGRKSEMRAVPISMDVIEKVSQVRLHLPENLRIHSARYSVQKSIDEVQRRFGDGIPLLDPRDDLRIRDKAFEELVKNIVRYEERLHQHPLHSHGDMKEIYNAYDQKLVMKEEVKNAKKELRKAKTLLQMDELKCRKRVLRRLGYCSGEDVIEMKGRVACELSSGDELLLTEMIFNGMFIDLDAPKTTALLSCLVCDERSKEVPKLGEELSGPLKMMQEMARQIAKVSKECKLDIDEDAYVEQFQPFLMDVVHAWCKGASFSAICEMTDIYEGGIIRSMRRLEELMRQMSLAAKVIGNKDLEVKFNDGIKLIKRDIVFAASLYL